MRSRTLASKREAQAFDADATAPLRGEALGNGVASSDPRGARAPAARSSAARRQGCGAAPRLGHMLNHPRSDRGPRTLGSDVPCVPDTPYLSLFQPIQPVS